jgi:RecB family exonuclease
MKKTKDCIQLVASAPEELVELSNSKMKTFRQCQFQFFLKYVEKFRPIRKKKSLTTGSWVHACLEAKNRGQSMEEAFKKFLEKEWNPLFAEEKQELGDIPGDVRKILKKYSRAYKKNDEQYTPVLVEQDFIIEIPGTPVALTGKIDRIVTDEQDRYWIWEYKTAKKIPENDLQLLIEPQTNIYMFVLQELMRREIIPKRKIGGVVYDYIRSTPPSEPFELKRGGLSVAQNKLGCDYYSYVEKIKELGLNPKDYAEVLSQLKAGESRFLRRIAITKSPVTVSKTMKDLIFTGNEIFHRLSQKSPLFPKNITYTCTRNGDSKCDYSDICLLDLQGQNYKQLEGILYERSNLVNEQEEESND